MDKKNYLNDKDLSSKLHTMNKEDLNSIAQEIRDFLIQSISQTGGHIGPNLGVIELTIALHYVFDMQRDKILFDVGHQGYTHKLLTGRKKLFSTLNSVNGMSRFISPSESKYDILDASHGGTAISIGTGIAYANKQDKNESITMSVVGDGAFVEGMSFEGLNYASAKNLPLLIIINDNGMSIPKNVGAVNNILKDEVTSSNFFKSMGFNYCFIPDGHDLDTTISIMKKAKTMLESATTVVHIKTVKGKGLDIAKEHPYKLHFSLPFNPQDGSSTSPVANIKSYTQVVEKSLEKIIKEDKNSYVITPSTPYASGLDKLLLDFPDNTIDVGMAEQQAAGMAAGLAMNGKNVFLCYQSTFMQRAMDQIFHDICFMNLPVTIIASRSGFAGFDSPTHHAIYDLSYLRGLPNLEIFYAATSFDLEQMLHYRHKHAIKPMIILHPYEAIRDDENQYIQNKNILEDDIIFNGVDGYILAVGNRLSTAIQTRAELKKYGKDIGIIHIKWIQPLQEKFLINILKETALVISLEENRKEAGFGSSISELICDNNLSTKLIRIAINNNYTSTGDKDYLSKLEEIDTQSIINTLKTRGIIC